MKRLLLAGLVVAGCAFEPQVITGDSKGVTVKASSNHNPGPLAQAHCADFEKSAVLVEVAPVTVAGLTAIYNFRCEKR